MTKYGAYGPVINMGAGDVPIETATVAGAITEPGNIACTITCANFSVPLVLAIPVLDNDTAAMVAAEIRAYLITNAAAATVRTLFEIGGLTDKVILTRKIPMADDGTLNIATATGSATGLSSAPTSAPTHAGETLAPLAYVQNISGPGFSLDIEDVTTHDQTVAWEEVVPTIIRNGELALDIVYDPGEATHDATTGLAAVVDTRAPVVFSMVFPDATEWAFAAYVNGMEPSAAHDGALTASVKLKVTGIPILE